MKVYLNIPNVCKDRKYDLDNDIVYILQHKDAFKSRYKDLEKIYAYKKNPLLPFDWYVRKGEVLYNCRGYLTDKKERRVDPYERQRS